MGCISAAMLKASLFIVAAADEWEAWKQEHGKVYNGDEEDAYRRTVFEANMARIPSCRRRTLMLSSVPLTSAI